MDGQLHSEAAEATRSAVCGDSAARMRRIVALAEGQQANVTRDQLLAAGLSRDAIDNWVKRGRLFQMHRGVYLLGHRAAPPFAVEMAAVLAYEPNSFVGALSATRMWGMLNRPEDPRPVSILVVGRAVHTRPGIRVQRTSDLPDNERTKLDGVPITTPARTLVDLAGVADARTLERALNEAQVPRLPSPSELLPLLAHHPRHRGTGALRAAIGDRGAPALTRSEAERRLLALIRAAKLPPPRTNVRVGPHEVDFFWPHQRLIVEVDGFRFHSSRHAFERDRARDGDLAALGYTVIRLTWRQIVHEPYAVVARIAQALRSSR